MNSLLVDRSFAAPTQGRYIDLVLCNSKYYIIFHSVYMLISDFFYFGYEMHSIGKYLSVNAKISSDWWNRAFS